MSPGIEKPGRINVDCQLIDYGIEDDLESDDYRTIVVQSDDQLREALESFSHKSPRILHLVAPSGDVLVVGIGGHFASLSWLKPPVELNCKIAIGDCRDAPSSLLVQDRGMEHSINQDQLFPLSKIVQAVSHFFANQEVPSWIRWRVWNSVNSSWDEPTPLPPEFL